VVIVSGFFVFFQFAFFLLIGSCLSCLWPHRVFEEPNASFATFIAKELPPGIRGVVLSGVFAAAMSTLAGTINALAASSVRDIAVGLFGLSKERAESVMLARLLSLLWVILLGAAAFLAAAAQKNAVDQALGIASITYGGVLGIFLLGRFTRVAGAPALVGFLVGTAVSAFLKFAPLLDIQTVYWPWLVPVGTTLTVVTALLPGFFCRAIASFRLRFLNRADGRED
jgi:Na+/proline symporter